MDTHAYTWIGRFLPFLLGLSSRTISFYASPRMAGGRYASHVQKEHTSVMVYRYNCIICVIDPSCAIEAHEASARFLCLVERAIFPAIFLLVSFSPGNREDAHRPEDHIQMTITRDRDRLESANKPSWNEILKT